MLFRNTQFSRFILAGAFNTLNGYLWILCLQAVTKQPFLSNTLGYGIAGIIGYIIHACFTYNARPKARTAISYAVLVGACYVINLALLSLFLKLFPPYLAQLLAITGFVVANYTGQSRFVFAKNSPIFKR